MKKNTLTFALGTAFVGALSLAPAAQAAPDGGNPFGLQKLDSGYQLAQSDKTTDGKCGEGKCGGAQKAADKKMEGKCGEGKCGTEKKPAADKKADGKCGEGKCGGDKKK